MSNQESSEADGAFSVNSTSSPVSDIGSQSASESQKCEAQQQPANNSEELLRTNPEIVTETVIDDDDDDDEHPTRTVPVIVISPSTPFVEDQTSSTDSVTPDASEDSVTPEASQDSVPPVAVITEQLVTLEDSEECSQSVESESTEPTQADNVNDEQIPSSESQQDASESEVLTPLEALVGATSSQESALKQSMYKVKLIKWKDASVPVVTQNENGPCPLIAIINVLLIKSKVNPFGSKVEISANDLMDYLGEFMFLSAPKDISDGDRLDYEQNMQDAFSVFPKLQTGLDVNVKFTGVRDFEYTPECIIFDLLNIPLYHGWLVDPQAKDAVLAVSKLSYNQLVEKIITNKSSSDNDLVTEALIAENFLERSASQLTYHGLYELNAIMKPDETAVLFRNNHFITIHKHKNELFQLVTDQGFLHEINVIWETLSNIEGDGSFVDSNFVTVPPKPASAVVVPSNVNLDEAEQIKQDYLVALSLQEDQNRAEEKAMIWQEYKEKELGATPEMTDEQLAWRLQEEEQKQAAQSQAEGVSAAGHRGGAASRQQSPEDSSRQQPQQKKKSDCTIV